MIFTSKFLPHKPLWMRALGLVPYAIGTRMVGWVQVQGVWVQYTECRCKGSSVSTTAMRDLTLVQKIANSTISADHIY